MKCHDCPYSLACMSGRLDRLLHMVGLCPECQRFYGFVNHVDKELEQRIAEGKKHGIDLDYERHLNLRYQQEYMTVFTPAPRTTVVVFKCEKRRLGPAEDRRWRSIAHKGSGFYRYTAGWSMRDPAGLMSDLLYIRPCPECCRWPEHHIMEDLDAQEKYETEKKGSTPAFRLKGRRHQGR